MIKKVSVYFALFSAMIFAAGCGLIKYVEIPEKETVSFSQSTFDQIAAVSPEMANAYSVTTYSAKSPEPEKVIHALETPLGKIETVKTAENIFDWVINLLAIFGGASVSACIPFIRRAKPLIKILDKLAFNVWGAKNSK